MKTIEFVCPRCRGDLKVISETELYCTKDGLTFRLRDGIWCFLLPERESHYARFISDYESVRRFEERGSDDPSYYRALPFQDLKDRHSKDWKIRAKSYTLLDKLMRKNRPHLEQGGLILDLGAGNSWLSNRLSSHGFDVSAVDLLLNPEDGLGAWKNYEIVFTPVQAEFMHLPFATCSASMVIYNASFHYSESYDESLLEALRVLKPDGQIVIMDSPVYHHASSGEQMVVERRRAFISEYGFPSDSIKSENYLTYKRMDELADTLKIHWRHIRPYYGIRWALRPALARLRGRREPAEFGLWVGTHPG